MDPSERLNLQRMIKENDVEETTDLIRNVKHSNQIRENVKILEKLRNENPEMVINNPDDFDDMCIFHCGFCFAWVKCVFIFSQRPGKWMWKF